MPSEMVYRAFGTAVARRRKSLGLTQGDLASRVGMSRAALANIETGRQGVLLHKVCEIAEALGLEGIDVLVSDRVGTGAVARALPIRSGDVTDVQREQVERTIRLALGRGRSLERRPA